MDKNYLKTAIRHLFKNKLFSFINILGLAIGTAACMVIFQYVNFELSYDNFHSQNNHIYRVVFHNYTNGKLEGRHAYTVSGLGPAIQETSPEEIVYTRVSPKQKTIVSYHPQKADVIKFMEDRIMYVEPSFLQIFSFPLIKGDVHSTLLTPRTLLISASSARKYFKDEDPVGKLLTVGEGEPFLIQGVFKDVPENSHIKFDFLLSYETLGQQKNEDWDWLDTITYLLLPSSASSADLESRFVSIVKQYHGNNSRDSYHLQPLGDIYLDETLSSGKIETGSARTVYFMITVGVVLMLIALVNFINLTTVKNLTRMKEIALRKMMGAGHIQLARQFFVEAIPLNGFAFLLAIGFTLMAVTFFEQFGWKWSQLEYLQQGWFWLVMGCLLVINIFITSIFPVLSLSLFQVIQAIKMTARPTIKRTNFTSFLIIFQFIASLVLLTGILIVHWQLRFLKNQDLAIDISQTLVIREPYLTDHTTAAKFHTFKNKLEKYTAIKSVTYSTSIPGQPIDWNRSDVKLQNLENERRYPSNIIGVGFDFLKTYKLRILVGRNFQETISTDAKAMLVNEEAAKQFEFASLEDAIGKKVFIGSREFHIIGIANNYHHLSLKEAIEPTLFIIGSLRRPVYSIKLNNTHLPATLAIIKQQWEQVYPDNIFSYFFLEEFYRRQYKADQHFGAIIGLFATLVLLVACLGLFGLASYTTVRRTKEIGIRKVLGGSVAGILVLLYRQYIQLIFIASLMAIPIANYFITDWLENFAYRIDVNWWMFLLPAVLILLIALLSVAQQTWKAANTNPVDSLQYE